MGLFGDLKNAGKVKLQPVTNSAELQRVLKIPRRQLIEDPELIDKLTAKLKQPGGTMRLRWIQAAALSEAAKNDGLFGMIGVGFGKTLTTLLLPEVMNSKKAVLLVPAQLKKQLRREIDTLYSKHFKIPLDRLSVYSYHDLSSAKFAEALQEAKPDLIILDEGHKLKAATSARTKRFMRYMRKNPGTRLAVLSGTLTKKVMEYAHLLELALRKNSPLPDRYYELQDWAGALDTKPRDPRAPGALKKFCEEGETVRQGFRRRLIETPGVVATSQSSLGTSLVVRCLKPKPPKEIQDALKELEKTWAIGKLELTTAIEMSRALRQVSGGFYYVWDWGGEPNQAWLDARSEWSCAARDFLRRRSRAGLDSRLLLREALHSGKLKDRYLLKTLQTWEAIKDTEDPKTKPIWLTEWILDEAEKWAKKHKKGVIWTSHGATEKAFEARGFPVYGQGKDSSIATEPIIVCTIGSQREGKNLQDRYSKNLILSIPSGGDVLEQLIGRTHRAGQAEDEVLVDWFGHTGILTNAFQTALEYAKDQEETYGQRQKLAYAQLVDC